MAVYGFHRGSREITELITAHGPTPRHAFNLISFHWGCQMKCLMHSGECIDSRNAGVRAHMPLNTLSGERFETQLWQKCMLL